MVENISDADAILQPRLTLPKGVRLVRPAGDSPVQIEGADETQLVWEVEADETVQGNCLLEIKVGEKVVATAALAMQFLPAVKIDKPPYIPEPQPVQTSILIGAHHCPLWEADKPRMWDNVRKHPERTPALGFYFETMAYSVHVMGVVSIAGDCSVSVIASTTPGNKAWFLVSCAGTKGNFKIITDGDSFHPIRHIGRKRENQFKISDVKVENVDLSRWTQNDGMNVKQAVTQFANWYAEQFK